MYPTSSRVILSWWYKSCSSSSPIFLSDDNDHDACFVFSVQRQIIWKPQIQISIREIISPTVVQHNTKNKKILDLVFHKDDFGINAGWTFFASQDGKSPSSENIPGLVPEAIINLFQLKINDYYTNALAWMKPFLDSFYLRIKIIKSLLINARWYDMLPVYVKTFGGLA